MGFFVRLLAWGIVIYAVIYLVWSGLVIYGFSQGIVSLVIRLLALIAVTSAAGAALRLSSWRDLIPYATGWTLVVIALDAVFLVPFAGWSLFASWSVWPGYALVAIAPLLAQMVRNRAWNHS